MVYCLLTSPYFFYFKAFESASPVFIGAGVVGAGDYDSLRCCFVETSLIFFEGGSAGGRSSGADRICCSMSILSKTMSFTFGESYGSFLSKCCPKTTSYLPRYSSDVSRLSCYTASWYSKNSSAAASSLCSLIEPGT